MMSDPVASRMAFTRSTTNSRTSAVERCRTHMGHLGICRQWFLRHSERSNPSKRKRPGLVVAPASSSFRQPAEMAKTPMAPWLREDGRVTLATVLPLVIGMLAAKTYVFTPSFPVV